MQKTFLLGLGAQKSGTTWLHRYLSDHPATNMGFKKEYHVLDAAHLPDCGEFRHRFNRMSRQALRSTPEKYTKGKKKYDITLMSFVANEQAYYAYFNDLLSNPQTTLTGDITPTYCALPDHVLRYVERQFANRGIVTRPVFLMREPTQRLRSMVKMKFRKQGVENPTREQELDRMREMCGSSYNLLRSNYARTLRNLDAVFGDNVYIGFYETLFQEKSMRALCDFLGIDYIPADTETRYNASPSENELTTEDLAEFRPAYRRQYAVMNDRFGKDFMEEIWGA